MRKALSGLFDLTRNSPDPLHVQMTAQIKAAVISGKLPARAAIPSSRVLASELGVSRNTVLAAVDQLRAEGILETVPGSGMRVADLTPPDFEHADMAGSRASQRIHRLAPRWQEPLSNFHPHMLDRPQPFQPGIPDLDAFPKEQWATSLRRAARLADSETAGYMAMSGHPHFRRVLAEHLREMRGVVAVPEQIIVTSSARGGISLIASALLSAGEDCWVEEPGFRSAKAIFGAAGGRLIPVPVDREGIDISLAPPESRPRLIYTTPSHQYPTGALMSLSRRLALIERASRDDGYIIEDDYDSEFQYHGRPIAALQGLDQASCVLYLGTFAKSLIPGIRVGFLVVPAGLVSAFEQIHRHTGQFVPPVMQLALADFIERGHYRAQVRRMKSVYATRLTQFAERMATSSGGALEAPMPDGGLQTVVSSRDGEAEQPLAERLAGVGVLGQPLRDFHLTPEAAHHSGLLMGFAAWSENEATRAFERIRKLFGAN